MDLGDRATGYSECGAGSSPTCPQSCRAALEAGSEHNCLPQGNQGSGDCVPVEMRITPTYVTIGGRFRVSRSCLKIQL